MYIREIEISNLFSFDDPQNSNDITQSSKKKMNHITFGSDVSLIVGPNNSGKSNIFRILKILVDTLELPAEGLDIQSIFSTTAEPCLSVKLTLSEEEANIIIDFISLLVAHRKVEDSYPLMNRDILLRLVDEISIKLSWSGIVNIYPQQAMRTNDIIITFEKIGLDLVQSSHTSELNIIFESNNYFPSSHIIKLLGESKSAEDFKNNFRSHTTELRNQATKLGLERLGERSPIMDEYERQVTTSIANFTAGYKAETGENLNLSAMLSIILKRSLYFSNRIKSNGVQQGKSYTTLNDDGSNMQQFLYHLKNSPYIQKRKRFNIIREKFRDTFNKHIDFDVMDDKYGSVKTETQVQSKDITNTIELVFIDENLGKQFTLQQAGGGLVEVLFLLTLSYGLTNSVILLDEPALNLHPPLLKSVMNEITKQESSVKQNKNQFIIITHFPELLHYLLFEKGAEVIYVKKTNGTKSAIYSSDSDTWNWIKNRKNHLKHQIDTRLFFGKGIICTEGQADRNLLLGTIQYFSSQDSELDLDRKDVLIISADGKNNFPRYKKLMDGFRIPYVLLGDGDVEKDIKPVKEIFSSPAYITVTGITGDNKTTYVIKNGDLETLMIEMDGNLYSQVREDLGIEHGRGTLKPIISYEFTKKLANNNPNKLNVIKDLMQKILVGLQIDTQYDGSR